MKKVIVCVSLMINVLLALVSCSFADTAQEMHFLLSGYNIYSPALIYDGTYRMWYGGWQSTSDYPNDRIYYRTSSDNRNWSSYITVLTPQQVSGNAVHLNDPSITKHFNSISGTWQYTMFYTVCMYPCNQSDQQIWSSVSNDGSNWLYHQPLITSSAGAAEPSIIIDQQPSGAFWKVYYVERSDPLRVKMANVNGNRAVISMQTVYTYTGQGVISNPEVKFLNNTWQLFYNVNKGNTVDIYKTVSISNTYWASSPGEAVIINSGAPYCATMTPGLLPVSGSDYDLYFALTNDSSAGGCDLTKQQSIHRWRMRD